MITVIGIDKLYGKLRGSVVAVPIGQLIGDAARFTAREAKSGLPNGAIAGSIIAEIHGLEARVHASGAALAVEFGRHPGTPPPPAAALRAWAAAHGLTEFIYPIARAISRRGIRGRFFMKRARAKLLSIEFPRLLGKAADQIADEWKR